MCELPGHAVPRRPFAAAPATPPIVVGVHDAAGQYRASRFESLPDHDEAEFVEAAERGQVGAGEGGSVKHVEVFRLGGVRTPILGRPRPLPRHRRAERYTLKSEEPRYRGCTVRDPAATPSADLVERNFTVTEPNRLWVTDITEHPTEEGKVYCAAVLDAFSRRIVGWSIADHMRTELVTDALGMAILRRYPSENDPENPTVAHSDHGSQYTSWAWGKRLRDAGMLSSMGSVGDCYDNAMMESFWGTMQIELLDRRKWSTRDELASAIFEWIECWYNPKRRHSSIGMHSPIKFEVLHSQSVHPG